MDAHFTGLLSPRITTPTEITTIAEITIFQDFQTKTFIQSMEMARLIVFILLSITIS